MQINLNDFHKMKCTVIHHIGKDNNQFESKPIQGLNNFVTENIFFSIQYFHVHHIHQLISSLPFVYKTLYFQTKSSFEMTFEKTLTVFYTLPVFYFENVLSSFMISFLLFLVFHALSQNKG